MRRCRRLVWAAGFSLAAFAGLWSLAGSFAGGSGSGLDLWGLSQEILNWKRELEREQALAILSDARARETQMKRQAVLEVVAGRMSLRRAASLFRDLHGRPGEEGLEAIYLRPFPGISIEERYCRAVIA